MDYMDVVLALATQKVPLKTIPDAVNHAIVSMDGLTQRVANNYRRYARLTWQRDRDDMCQIVREVAASMLQQLVDQTPVAIKQYPEMWESSLMVRARSAISAYADSSATTGIGRYTSAARRRRSIANMRSKWGTIPDAELLALYNDFVAHARKDPHRQSAFVTEADLAAPMKIYPAADNVIEARAGATAPELAPERLDYTKAIARCIKRCVDEDPDLGQAARGWLGWWPDGEPLTVIDLARRLQISRREASIYVLRIQTLMAAELGALGLAGTGTGATGTA